MGKIFTNRLAGLLGLAILITTIASCTTREVVEVAQAIRNTAPAPDEPSYDGPYSQYSDAHAVLIATKTKTTAAGVVLNFGTATAVFFAQPGDADFVDAGVVAVEGAELDIMPNNSYTYTDFAKTSTIFEGIEFVNPIQWTVSGNPPVTSFAHGLTGNFPSTDTIKSPTTVTKSAGYTLKVASVSNADSVLFNIGGQQGIRVTKILPGNAKTCTFTAAELASLPEGVGIVQVAPYRVTSATYSGRKNYFVREMVASQNVEIQD